jgi:hypothetical protein
MIREIERYIEAGKLSSEDLREEFKEEVVCLCSGTYGEDGL